jgi:hypothetical protein
MCKPFAKDGAVDDACDLVVTHKYDLYIDPHDDTPQGASTQRSTLGMTTAIEGRSKERLFCMKVDFGRPVTYKYDLYIDPRDDTPQGASTQRSTLGMTTAIIGSTKRTNHIMKVIYSRPKSIKINLEVDPKSTLRSTLERPKVRDRVDVLVGFFNL